MTFDDNAMFRRPTISELRDKSQEDPRETKAGDRGLSYVGLDGNIGCIINGAGLAMATMDMIKHAGGEPANFLDIGGRSEEHTSELQSLMRISYAVFCLKKKKTHRMRPLILCTTQLSSVQH